MKYLVLILLCLNLIGCADGEGVEAVSVDNGYTLIDSNFQNSCNPPPSVLITCSAVCSGQYYIKDVFPGIRRVYTSQSNCESNVGAIHQESIPWVNPARG